MKVLVTGGAGFIGSHTAVELLNSGREIVILDNFSNSNPEVLNRIKAISGKDFTFVLADLLDREAIDLVFEKYNIDSVIHFAGLKAVGESVSIPLKYYHNNILKIYRLITFNFYIRASYHINIKLNYYKVLTLISRSNVFLFAKNQIIQLLSC